MIIWMNDIKSRRFVSPSLDIHSQILEVHTIGVKRSSIALKYTPICCGVRSRICWSSLSVLNQAFALVLQTMMRCVLEREVVSMLDSLHLAKVVEGDLAWP